jgi:uncharacterized membrane protein
MLYTYAYHMEELKKDIILHKAFFATVIVNGCIALADMAAGFFFLFHRQITTFLYFSNYPFSTILQRVVLSISAQNQVMGMVYFFSHGVVKLILVWGLLTNRLWAYPLAIVLLSGFSMYQLYDVIVRFSWFTILLLIVNIITVFFISREYRQIIVK